MLHIIITFALVTAVLVINTVHDVKTKEIYPLTFIALAAVHAVLSLLVFNDFILYDALIGAAFGFIPFFALCLTSKGGLGDAIVMGFTCFTLGARLSIYLVIASSVIYIAYGVWKAYKQTKNDASENLKEGLKAKYPFTPFTLIGWGVTVVIYVLTELPGNL